MAWLQFVRINCRLAAINLLVDTNVRGQTSFTQELEIKIGRKLHDFFANKYIVISVGRMKTSRVHQTDGFLLILPKIDTI